MMEQYIPAGLVGLVVVGLITVKVGLAKRPTFSQIDKAYKKKEVCDEIHKSVDEKLKDIPSIKDTVTEIKTKIDIFLEANGKK
jgi:hypothetical protein